MTGPSYIQDLQARLHDVETRMAAARRGLSAGDTDRKAAALAEMTRLEMRRKDIFDRIEAGVAREADNWSDLRRGIRQEIDGLTDTFGRWIVKYG